jgi:arylsulfatase A-like enzyme
MYSAPVSVGQNLNAPNVLFLVFDALTARHISMFGYTRETMPNLARFSERAIVFHNHRSGANFTSPGTSTLLTGTYPWSHRAIQLQGVPSPEFSNRNIFSLFSQRGYYQNAYTHNPLAMSVLLAFREGLNSVIPTRQLCILDEQFSDLVLRNDWSNSFQAEWEYLRGGEFPPGSLLLSWLHRLVRVGDKRKVTKELQGQFPLGVPSNFNAYFILEDAIDWIQGQLVTLPQPFLSYVHLLPPHDPYSPRKDFVDIFSDEFRPDTKPDHPLVANPIPRQQLQQGRRRYDEYVAYADSELGRLLDFMVENGILDHTILVFTSDHGEAFERGVMGHLTPLLYDPLLTVPLMISVPGQTSRQDVFAPTSNVDILPTLLELTGQPVPEWIEGQVLPPFAKTSPDEGRTLYAVEAKSNPKNAPLTRKATVAMISAGMKLIRYIGYPGLDSEFELYNLTDDPEESTDLIRRETGIAEELKAELSQKLRQVDEPYSLN